MGKKNTVSKTKKKQTHIIMKKTTFTITIFLMFLSYNFYGQVIRTSTNTVQHYITFTYDQAGNQIKRCFDCNNKGKNTKKNQDQLVDKTINKLNYYPNPVQDNLTINWENTNVSVIQVFDINNKLLATYKVDQKIQEYQVQFKRYTSGIYIVKVLFTNNQQESFKIIKK
jgi:hypothetical protein